MVRVAYTLPLVWLATLVHAAPEQDVVGRLPGWDAPLFSKTYAGYIPVGEEDGHKMYEHYLFFESEGDPKKDPLIMWTNGGPGASSFFGSFAELGPYYLSYGSLQTDAYKATGVPTLFEHAHRWTKLGSLLIRNLPPPVGFSYCDPAGPSGDGYSCGSWNDTRTARHSLEFMKGWRAAFPEFGSHDLFLTGESYAGLYVPMLAREILERGPPELAAQLKGIAVGDGCLGGGGIAGDEGGCTPFKGPYFQVEFFHGHGQFSDKTYAEIQRSCPHDELVNGVTTPACKEALNRMDEEKGYSFDYNLYDECYDFGLARMWHEWQAPSRKYWGPVAAPLPAEVEAPLTSSAAVSEPRWHMDGSPCGGTSVLTKWVAAAAVKEALHVAPDAKFFTGDNGHGFVYNLTEPSMEPWYKNVVQNTKLRVLIYNGDTDPSLNSIYAQNWTASLGLKELEPWRQWTKDGGKKVGGYVTRYEGDFDYLTIRGSGHMVPEYKPEAAYVMLKSFLKDEEYPRFKPSSVHAAAEATRASSPQHQAPAGDVAQLIV